MLAACSLLHAACFCCCFAAGQTWGLRVDLQGQQRLHGERDPSRAAQAEEAGTIRAHRPMIGLPCAHRRLAPGVHRQQGLSGGRSTAVVCSAHSSGNGDVDPARFLSPRWDDGASRAPRRFGPPQHYAAAPQWPAPGVGEYMPAAPPESGLPLWGSSSLAHAPPPVHPETATVRFHLKYRTYYGQGVKLVGSHPKLGNWNLQAAVDLTYRGQGDLWTATVQLPAGFVYEYKYVLVDYATKVALEWQSGSNAVLAVVVSETDVSVYDNWGNSPGAMVQVDEERMTRESKLQQWAGEMMGYWRESRRLQFELVHQSNEAQGLRNESAQLRMELSLEKQARMRAEQHNAELQLANMRLKTQLVQKTVELNNTLAEVLALLDKELEGYDDGDVDDEEGLYEHDEGMEDDEEEEGEEQEEEEEEEEEEAAEEEQASVLVAAHSYSGRTPGGVVQGTERPVAPGNGVQGPGSGGHSSNGTGRPVIGAGRPGSIV